MKKLLVILFAVALYSSCIKPVPPDEDFCAEGHIFWGGDPATDPNGLGWFFAIKRTGNWKFYQVKDAELPSAYKNLTDSVGVSICLVSTKETAPCPCVQPSYYYKIKSISKR